MTDSPEDFLEVEAPIALLPDLTVYGIEEVEPGVCLDTAENRRILRSALLRWVPVYKADGDDTPYIQAVTADMNESRTLVTKKRFLTDSRNADSDYISGLALLLEPEVEGFVPSWVFAMTRQWVEVADERERRAAKGVTKEYRPKLIGPPIRCRATRMDGHRCQNWSGNLLYQDGYCKLHVNADQRKNFAPSTVDKARAKAQHAASTAIEVLEELAISATSEPVRMNAARDILDRAGVRGGTELDVKATVEVGLAESLIRERLGLIAENLRPPVPELEELEVEVEEDPVTVEIVSGDGVEGGS